MLFRRTPAIVGVDIGSSAVKAVELKPVKRGYCVASFGAEPLPIASILEGVIIDGGAVSDAVRRLFEARRIGTNDVASSLSGNAVMVKKIAMPQMSDAELAHSIYWEAEQHVPFDIQDVILDYQILPGAGTKTGDTMDVLLVAAKRERINDYTGVITRAGRTPVVLDVDVLALQNAYEANYGIEPNAIVALLNAGASGINVNILQGEQPVFTRDIPIGGNAYTRALQKELKLSRESAEAVKRGQSVDQIGPAESGPVLRGVTETVLFEIQKTLDFFRATSSAERIDRIMLTGGTSRLDGLAAALQERFVTQVERLDPFRKIAFDAGKFGIDPAEVAPTVAVAVGLALRKAGDR